ncbi:hypothetical protein [Serratia quinivorans]|uniref:hypothetical protein n=1 Tax=Serratia quinivorans TaxID=137545 RepID=UPI00217ABFBB|nr:hypothetical protein [Serratia quinivorans]CAI0923793.1 Uncharacterised protein [Serratia quinivorans]
MTILTERLKEIVEDGFLAHGEAKALAAELLKYKEAQPVVIIPSIWKHFSGSKVAFIYEQAMDAAGVKWRSVDDSICSPCNERYCGNCIHSNGAIVR